MRCSDEFNFVNFCVGKTITNGQQIEGGSCNPIPMGNIPSTANMISCLIVSPKVSEDVAADKTFKVEVQTIGLAAGTFTNPKETYYSAPQDLDGSGRVIGHIHVTIQILPGGLEPKTPLDPTDIAFFKGINDVGNGNGLLSADVEGGLPAGFYRICTITSAANHQPVVMPVAKRGAQEDCIRITVGGGGPGGKAKAPAAPATPAVQNGDKKPEDDKKKDEKEEANAGDAGKKEAEEEAKEEKEKEAKKEADEKEKEAEKEEKEKGEKEVKKKDKEVKNKGKEEKKSVPIPLRVQPERSPLPVLLFRLNSPVPSRLRLPLLPPVHLLTLCLGTTIE